MKTYLLVFDDGSDAEIDLQAFTEQLDDGGQIYSMDAHVCFIRSMLDAAVLTERFLPVAGSRLFFVTAVSATDHRGRMLGWFWDFLRGNAAISTAA